jgi:hypothetical protein
MFNHLKINKMKKIFGVIGVAAFAVVVALSVNAGLNRNAAFDVTLANVEALGGGEVIMVCPNIGGECLVQIGQGAAIYVTGWQP